MQLFGGSFQIIKQLIATNGKQPSPVALVYEHDGEVAKWLSDRASFPILGIIEALEPIKQPELIHTKPSVSNYEEDITVSAPIPMIG